MIERILNSLFWLDTTFTRSSDPFIEEYRRRQRFVVGAAVISAGATFMAFLFAPASAPTTGVTGEMVQSVQSMVATIFAGIGGLTALGLLWNIYRLWQFIECHAD